VVYNSAKSIINKINLKMKEQKSVRNRLFKTEKVELESQKVELSSTSDLEKKINEIKSFLKKYRNIKKDVQESAKIIKQARKLNDDGFDLRSSSSKLAIPIKKQAKELGVDFREIPIIKEYAKVVAELDALNSEILRELPR